MLINNLCLKFDVLGQGPLTIKIKFDDTEIFCKPIGENDQTITVTHKFLNLPKDHTLSIYIDGKTPNMTVIDTVTNRIISDTVFRLQSVELGAASVGEIFYLNAQYHHTQNGSKEMVTQLPSDISGFNGHIEWKFYGPANKWLYNNGLIDRPGIIQRIKNSSPQFFKNFKRKIKNIFGIDVFSLIKIFYFPKYIHHLYRWKKLGGQVDGYEPILNDFYGTEAGRVTGAYFYQDIVVASEILKQQPTQHVTIGSNFTGFVGHVATFMPVTFCDIRPITAIPHPNISFVQCDLGSQDFFNSDLVADSVSCLSCLHHVGSGRYGGQVNPNGPFEALANLQKIVRPGGFLYIGTNIGTRSRVVFNQSRSFTVDEILKHLPNFDLVRFDYYNSNGNVMKQYVSVDEFDLIPDYSYGIFVLKSKLS
jgi:hypothetical protein